MSEVALMSLRFLPASALGLSAIAILVGCESTTVASEAEDTSRITMEDPAQWVDPFIGTDRMGRMYSIPEAGPVRARNPSRPQNRSGPD